MDISMEKFDLQKRNMRFSLKVWLQGLLCFMTALIQQPLFDASAVM